MINEIPTWIKEEELTFIGSLICSVIAGFIIGAERESRGKEAGISTHMLVIIGAALFTFLSYNVDPASKSRIAAQVITGIGFLGAGLIIKDSKSVRNLTTAASLWISAGIGMAFGFGYYFIGIITTVTVALIPRVPHIRKRNLNESDTDRS